MSFGGKSFKREELRLKQELEQLSRQSKHEFAGLNTIDKSKLLESSSKTALAQRSQPTKQGGSHSRPKKSTKSKRRDTETRESDGEIPPPSPSIDLAPELRATPDSGHAKAVEKGHVFESVASAERRTSDLISRSTGIASIRSKVDLNVVMYGKGLGDESNLNAKFKEKVNYHLAQLRCQPFQELNLMQIMYLISQEKRKRFPFLDILGYLKNTHKNPKFGKMRQVPTREFPTKFPDWDVSHSSKFGIFVGIL